MKIVAMLGFALRMKDYALIELLEPVNKIMEKEKQAAAAAAPQPPAGSQPAALVEAAPQKMKLDVVIDTPEIVIPENATSTSTVVAELGSLRVTNSFKVSCPYKHEEYF